MSERELVMAHLWDRVLKAFAQFDNEEAQSCVRFHDALASMTDAEYLDVEVDVVTTA